MFRQRLTASAVLTKISLAESFELAVTQLQIKYEEFVNEK